MKEFCMFAFINLAILSLFLHFSQLIKIEEPNNYLDENDFYIINFQYLKLKFNLSIQYIDEVSNNLLFNQFYEYEENKNEKIDYIVFESLLILILYCLCLCECFYPLLLLFIILVIHFFSNLNRVNFNNNKEKFFPINHEGILLIKFIIELLLLIITFIMLVIAIKNKSYNCLCCKKKKAKHIRSIS